MRNHFLHVGINPLTTTLEHYKSRQETIWMQPVRKLLHRFSFCRVGKSIFAPCPSEWCHSTIWVLWSGPALEQWEWRSHCESHTLQTYRQHLNASVLHLLSPDWDLNHETPWMEPVSLAEQARPGKPQCPAPMTIFWRSIQRKTKAILLNMNWTVIILRVQLQCLSQVWSKDPLINQLHTGVKWLSTVQTTYQVVSFYYTE